MEQIFTLGVFHAVLNPAANFSQVLNSTILNSTFSSQIFYSVFKVDFY